MSLCANCPKQCPSWGDPSSKLLILGMAPSRQDLLEGKPFSGGVGKILWSAAKRHGIGPEDCYLMTAISCWPLGKDGTPLPDQLEACRERFHDELRGSSAEVILSLGGDTFSQLTGLSKKIIDQRGYMYSPSDCKPVKTKVTKVIEYKTSRKNPDGTFKYQKGDPREVTETIYVPTILPPKTRYIIPTLHPSSIMREGLRTLPAFKADLDRAIRASRNEAVPMEIVFGDEVPESRTKGPAVAVDLETSMSTGQIERVGISDGTTTWTAEWTPKAREATRRELADEARIKIAHNIQFDLPRLGGSGVPMPGQIFDTMLAAHLIQPDLYKALGRTAPLYLDLRAWKHLSMESPAYYNACDAGITIALYHQQREALDDTGMTSLFCDTIMPATRVLMDMTKRGMRVDMEWLRGWRRELATEQQMLLSKWSSSVGNVNPFSPPQLKKYLYGELDLPVQKSKFGGVTTDESAIKTLREKSPGYANMLNLLLRIREISKLKSTYSEVAIGQDGCVHPGYLPASKDTDRAGAATGRLTSFIHTQPPVARRMYIPREGMVFLEADFSQIELRIAASLSMDARLLEALQDGDVHERTMQLLGCDRVRAKNVVYGSLYGAGPRKLAALLKQRGVTTSERECRDLQDKLAKAYPDLWGWRTEVAEEAATNGFLINPFSRRRYFYAGKAQAPEAIDYLPQSTAADILWRILAPLQDLLEQADSRLVTTVHDSILCESPRDKVDDISEILREVMEQEFKEITVGFRCPVNIKTGLNWKDLS